MKKQTIRHIFRQQNKKVYKSLKAMCDDYEPEHVHAFRVQVKKFRAFLHLLSVAAPKRRYKLPKDIKQAYIMAGRIRTYQLQAAMTGTQPGLADYTASIHAHIQRLQAIAKMQTYHLKKYRRNISRLEEKLPRKISRNDVESFFRKCLCLLQNEPIAEQSLHSLRRSLKDLQYDIPLLERIMPAEKLVSQTIDPQLLADNADLLGQYLDSHIYLQLIRSDRNIYPPGGATREALLQLEKHWLTVQHQLHRQLVDTLTSLKKHAAAGRRVCAAASLANGSANGKTKLFVQYTEDRHN